MTDYIFVGSMPKAYSRTTAVEYDIYPYDLPHTFDNLADLLTEIIGTEDCNLDRIAEQFKVFSLVPIPPDELQLLIEKRLEEIRQRSDPSCTFYYRFKLTTSEGKRSPNLAVRASVAMSSKSLEETCGVGLTVVQHQQITEVEAKTIKEYMGDYLNFLQISHSPLVDESIGLFALAIEKALATFDD